MAIFNHGIFSKAKNKLGGVTFQQYEGMQIGKEYQPNVKNPNTIKQIEARANFKLASQMVALYQEIILIVGAKLSSYSRYIRGAFVSAVSRLAEFSEASLDSSLSIDGFALAVNTKVGVSSIPTPTISGSSAQNATITATVGDVVTYEVVALDSSNNIIGRSVQSFTATATPQAVVLPITPTTPSVYNIVAVATRAMTENGTAIYDNLAEGYMIHVTRLVNSGDVAASNIAAIELPQA